MDNVKEVVKQTVDDLIRRGYLRKPEKQEVREIGTLLSQYYKGKENADVREVLNAIRDDPYFDIFPMYYRNGLTLEAIAERFRTEVSTISRNKKRLCLRVAAALRNRKDG